MTRLQHLRAELSHWPSNWEADIDDPGTAHEEWTGKWYASHDGEERAVEIGDDYSAALGRHLATLHNAADDLLTLAEASVALAAAMTEECKVCCAKPDNDGTVWHGKGCYVASSDGGGTSSVDLDTPRLAWLAAVERVK